MIYGNEDSSRRWEYIKKITQILSRLALIEQESFALTIGGLEVNKAFNFYIELRNESTQ